MVGYECRNKEKNATFISGVGHHENGLVSILDLEAVENEKEVKEKAQ